LALLQQDVALLVDVAVTRARSNMERARRPQTGWDVLLLDLDIPGGGLSVLKT